MFQAIPEWSRSSNYLPTDFTALIVTSAGLCVCGDRLMLVKGRWRLMACYERKQSRGRLSFIGRPHGGIIASGSFWLLWFDEDIDVPLNGSGRGRHQPKIARLGSLSRSRKSPPSVNWIKWASLRRLSNVACDTQVSRLIINWPHYWMKLSSWAWLSFTMIPGISGSLPTQLILLCSGGSSADRSRNKATIYDSRFDCCFISRKKKAKEKNKEESHREWKKGKRSQVSSFLTSWTGPWGQIEYQPSRFSSQHAGLFHFDWCSSAPSSVSLEQ